MKQAYWFQATPKEIVGGLEEESDFLSPLLLVDLDHVEVSYGRMAPITVKKVEPLVARINKLHKSYSMIPHGFSFQSIYEADYWIDEDYETHSVGMPYYDYYFKENGEPVRSEAGRLRDPYHDIAFNAWIDATRKARGLPEREKPLLKIPIVTKINEDFPLTNYTAGLVIYLVQPRGSFAGA